MRRKTKLDQVDLSIISILKSDPRIPYTEIAKKVGRTSVSVRRRVHKLLESGILKITAEIDYSKIYKDWKRVFVLVRSKTGENLSEALEGIEFAEVFRVLGNYSHVLIIEGKNMEEIMEKISRLPDNLEIDILTAI